MTVEYRTVVIQNEDYNRRYTNEDGFDFACHLLAQTRDAIDGFIRVYAPDLKSSAHRRFTIENIEFYKLGAVNKEEIFKRFDQEFEAYIKDFDEGKVKLMGSGKYATYTKENGYQADNKELKSWNSPWTSYVEIMAE